MILELAMNHLNEIMTGATMALIVYLYNLSKENIESRMDDMRADYFNIYQQVSGIRERIVKLEEEFHSHDKNEMMKYGDIKKAFKEIHESLSRIDPDLKLKHLSFEGYQ